MDNFKIHIEQPPKSRMTIEELERIVATCKELPSLKLNEHKSLGVNILVRTPKRPLIYSLSFEGVYGFKHYTQEEVDKAISLVRPPVSSH